MKIARGKNAPDFVLPDQNSGKIALSDFRNQHNIVLVFSPFSFSSVCEAELSELRDEKDMFEQANACLIAISCDSVFTQTRFAIENGLSFPLLSDFWPHGQVSRLYGVFNEALGCANRDTFIIDRKGLVAGWFASADLGTARTRSQYEQALLGLV